MPSEFLFSTINLI